VVGASHGHSLVAAIEDNGVDTTYMEYSGPLSDAKTRAAAIDMEMRINQLNERTGVGRIAVVYHVLNSHVYLMLTSSGDIARLPLGRHKGQESCAGSESHGTWRERAARMRSTLPTRTTGSTLRSRETAWERSRKAWCFTAI